MKFFLKLAADVFREGEVLQFDSSKWKGLVIKTNCKDKRWRKVLRFFGLKIFDPTGCILIKRIK
jgi:hypothetical protein